MVLRVTYYIYILHQYNMKNIILVGFLLYPLTYISEKETNEEEDEQNDGEFLTQSLN